MKFMAIPMKKTSIAKGCANRDAASSPLPGGAERRLSPVSNIIQQQEDQAIDSII